jgi:Glycosyl hydrolase family 26
VSSRIIATLLLATLIVVAGSPPAAARSRIAIGLSVAPALAVDMRVVDRYIARYGARPALWSVWSNWGSRGGERECQKGKGSCAFPSEVADGLRERGITPLIWWAPVAPPGLERGQYARFTRIIDGLHDDYIRVWAQDAKAHGGPIVLRFAHEMNGKWYPWGLSRFDNSPRLFKKAWRHVWRIFHDVGATNVRFLWNPMPERCNGCAPFYRYWAFYPGDRYVDYVGVNVYNYGPAGWRSMPRILEKPLRRLRTISRTKALPRGKPVILGEVATSFRGGDKARWLERGYLQAYQRWPQVKGIVYFDVDMRRDGHADWRLIRPKDGSAMRVYRQLAARPIFRGHIR